MSYESLLHSLLFVIDFFWSPCLKKEWQYLIGLPSRSKFLPLLFSLNFFFTLFFAVTFSVYINDRLPVVMKELPKGDNQIEGRSAQLCQCHLFVSSLLFQANLESPVTQRANSAAISNVVFHIFFLIHL